MTKIALGTWAWGAGAFGGDKVFGSKTDVENLKPVFDTAMKARLNLWDTATVYGMGESEKILGALAQAYKRADVQISTKFTPQIAEVFENSVEKMALASIERMGCDYIDIYWIHNPMDVERWTPGLIPLLQSGKVKRVGVSNHNIKEIRRANEILGEVGFKVSAVQNHYSLLAREWERGGLVDWCKENGVQFWAWAVLEEGMLVPPKAHEKQSVMKLIFRSKRRKLAPLYRKMQEVGRAHGLTIPQVATAFCSSKGIVPICGCRKPYQVQELAQSVSVTLSTDEIRQLEQIADSLNIRVLGADMFRFAVKS